MTSILKVTLWSIMAAGAPAIVSEFHASGKRKKGRAKEVDFCMLIKVLLKLTIILSFGVPFHPTISECLPSWGGEEMKRPSLVCSAAKSEHEESEEEITQYMRHLD